MQQALLCFDMVEESLTWTFGNSKLVCLVVWTVSEVRVEVENGFIKKLFREAFKGLKTIRFDTCMRMISVPQSRVENTHHKSIRSLTRNARGLSPAEYQIVCY